MKREAVLSYVTFSSIWNLLCFCKMVQGIYETGKVYRKGSYFYVINSDFIYKQKHWGLRELNCRWDSRCPHAGAGWKVVWIPQVNTPGFLIQSLPRETHITHFFHIGRGITSAANSSGWTFLKLKYHFFQAICKRLGFVMTFLCVSFYIGGTHPNYFIYILIIMSSALPQ